MRHGMRQNLRWLSARVKWPDLAQLLRKHPEQVVPQKLLRTLLALPVPWWQELEPKVAQDLLPLVRAACIRWGGKKFVALHQALRATPNSRSTPEIVSDVVQQYNALPKSHDTKQQVAQMFANWAATAWLASHGTALYERLLCRQAWPELLLLRNTLCKLPLQIRPLLLSTLEKWRPRQQHLLTLRHSLQNLPDQKSTMAQTYRFAMYLEGPAQSIEVLLSPQGDKAPKCTHTIGPAAARRLVDHVSMHLPPIEQTTKVTLLLAKPCCQKDFWVGHQHELQQALMRMTQIGQL